jgi:hypothetical protein
MCWTANHSAVSAVKKQKRYQIIQGCGTLKIRKRTNNEDRYAFQYKRNLHPMAKLKRLAQARWNYCGSINTLIGVKTEDKEHKLIAVTRIFM